MIAKRKRQKAEKPFAIHKPKARGLNERFPIHDEVLSGLQWIEGGGRGWEIGGWGAKGKLQTTRDY